MNLKLISVFVLIVLLMAAATVYKLDTGGHENLELLTKAPTGGDFVLRTKQGEFSLEDQRGKVVLIYFGYTFCPDICPTNLSLMTQALNDSLEAQVRANMDQWLWIHRRWKPAKRR